MKKSEIIKTYRKDIAQAMVNRYRTVLDSNGRIQYKVYVWEDGEIECLEGVQGDNSYLKAKDTEPRELFYIATISWPCFDPFDYWDGSTLDDETEKETARQQIIDYLVDEYEREGVSDALDAILAEAQYED